MSAKLDRALLVVALAAWIVAALLALLAHQPLKHDEAAYALGAQRLLAGAPAVWLYRSIGTELLAVPGVLLGGADPAGAVVAIRVAFVLATLTVPLGAYALARAAFPTRHVGGLAAAILAGGHQMTLQASYVLGDLPAAGMLLLGLALLVRELARSDGPRGTIVLAAPLLAAAFYLRYGSVPALLAIVVGLAACYGRVLARAPVRIGVLVAVAVALVVPHLAYSVHVTGTLLGVLDDSAHATRFVYPGEGLVTYVTANPLRYYGALVTPVMLVGLVTCWRSREARCIAIVALATLVILGVRSHAQPRYAFSWVAMLVVLGAGGIAAHVDAVRAKIVAAVVVLTIVLNLVYVRGTVGQQADRRDHIVGLAQEIARDAAGRPCAFIATRQPQLAYYSGCLAADWPGVTETTRTYLVTDAPQGEVPNISGKRVTRLPGFANVFLIEAE